MQTCPQRPDSLLPDSRCTSSPESFQPRFQHRRHRGGSAWREGQAHVRTSDKHRPASSRATLTTWVNNRRSLSWRSSCRGLAVPWLLAAEKDAMWATSSEAVSMTAAGLDGPPDRLQGIVRSMTAAGLDGPPDRLQGIVSGARERVQKRGQKRGTERDDGGRHRTRTTRETFHRFFLEVSNGSADVR